MIWLDGDEGHRDEPLRLALGAAPSWARSSFHKLQSAGDFIAAFEATACGSSCLGVEVEAHHLTASRVNVGHCTPGPRDVDRPTGLLTAARRIATHRLVAKVTSELQEYRHRGPFFSSRFAQSFIVGARVAVLVCVPVLVNLQANLTPDADTDAVGCTANGWGSPTLRSDSSHLWLQHGKCQALSWPSSCRLTASPGEKWE
jgi:hypothetical protein